MNFILGRVRKLCQVLRNEFLTNFTSFTNIALDVLCLILYLKDLKIFLTV